MKSVRLPVGRGLMLAAISTLGVLGLFVGSAAAAVPNPLNTGTGGWTAVATADFVPGPISPSTNPCALYTGYDAELAFSGETLAAQIHSDAGVKWGEDGSGTHPSSATFPDCKSAVGPVPSSTPTAGQSFSGVLTGVSGGAPVACQLSAGKYQRGSLSGSPFGSAPVELNVQFTFSVVTTVSGSCPTAPFVINATIPGSPTGPTTQTATGLIPIFGQQNYVAACTGLIAPASCALAPAGTVLPGVLP